MGVSVKIPSSHKEVKRAFTLPELLSAELDQYVTAAKEENPHCTDSLVLQAILEKQFKRDRAFRKWVQHHVAKASA